MNCSPDLIVAGNVGEYKVHRIVILCLSPYFQKLFHYRSQSRDGYYRIDMNDVSDSSLVSIINFAYNGWIDITDDNVEELVITADKYNIIPIIKRCQHYLWLRLDSENCFEIYLLSYFYNCYELMAKTEDYIIDNKLLDQIKDDSFQKKFTIERVLYEWHKRNNQ